MEELPELPGIRRKVVRREYQLTSHAEHERDSEKITLQGIEEALLSGRAEVIESYPEDVRGRSCLVLGFTEVGSPLHMVCGLGQQDLVIVTVYRPDPDKWIDWRMRRKTRS